VYLTAADRHGNVISLIQSLYGAFGSGVVAGDTGIVLQNRGALFSLDRTHPNCLAPRKRPFHTLIPAMVLRDGVPWLSYGVMGGDMQAQGHAQVLSNLVVFGMNVQEAGEAARIRWTGDALALESGVPTRTRDALAHQGHQLTDEAVGFGGYQGIVLDATTGTLHGGSDPRKDGCALGY
jgi:gamma-glutamyltranspeptidase/glutathione hydrolase